MPPTPGPRTGREKLCDAPPVVLMLRLEAEAAWEAYREGGVGLPLVLVTVMLGPGKSELGSRSEDSEDETRRGGGRIGGAGA